MRRVVLSGIGVLIVASAVWMGGRVMGEWSRLREIDREMREQRSVVENAREERKKLREQIEAAGAELQEIPDSLGTRRTGFLMRRSFDFAKMEANVEQELLRAQRRLRHLGTQRETVAKDLVWWGVALAVVEILLVGGAVVVRRYAWRAR